MGRNSGTGAPTTHRQMGLSRVASIGQWGMTIEVTSCYFSLLPLPTVLFF